MKNLVASLFVLLLAGCAVVPQTEITIPTARGPAMLKSPKETSWEGVEVTLSPDGTFQMKAKSVKAANQADVVKIVTDSNERMFNKGLELGQKLLDKAPMP